MSNTANAAKKEQKKPAPQKETPITQLEVKRMPTRQPIRSIDWDVVVPVGTTIKDLLRPEYWAKVSGNTLSGSQYSIVRVHWEDKKQYAEFYVRAADQTYAVLELLNHVEFKETRRLECENMYDIVWVDMQTKHRIIRKSDNQVIKDGIQSKASAEEYIKTLGTAI